MLDWDYDHNDLGSGYLTLYLPDYDTEDGIIQTFRLKDLDSMLRGLDIIFTSHKDEIEADDHWLIGINSNSFTGKEENKHNLFLEWDRKYGLPDLEKLKKEEGVITKTDNGYHFLKEAWLSLDELIKKQFEWNCCKGFVKHTKETGNACLRVCPKGENNINIIDYHDSLLHNVYKEIVLKLGGEYGVA